MASWKETLGISGKGIPGVTRPVDSTGNEMVVYNEGNNGRRNVDSPGCLSIITAPVDLLALALTATVGGGMLAVGRGVKVTDPTIPLKHESAKRKNRREKMATELDGPANWTKSINNTISSMEQLRANPNRISSLAARTLGPENMAVIDGSLAVNQRTPVEVKPIQEKEISFAQKILAAANGTDRGFDDVIISEIRQEALENLQRVGEIAADQMEAKRLTQLKDESNFVVTEVGWWEAVLAATGFAKGFRKQSIQGGYVVSVKDGNMVLTVGKDENAMAPPEQIAVDIDMPGVYTAALSVADRQKPKFGQGKFARVMRWMIGMDSQGNMPLKPGAIIIGLTGSPDKDIFPALNVDVQRKRITSVSTASGQLGRRLEKLKSVKIESDPDKMTRRLVKEAVAGVQDIPRSIVVRSILDKISPIDQEITKPSVVEKRSVVSEQVAVTLPVQKVEKARKPSQLELDLQKVGFGDIDERNAKIIIKHKRDFEKMWTEKYGDKEAKRLMRNISRRARTILNL